VRRNTWYFVGGIVAAALVFQLFFHYQYVHLAGGDVMRIDRLTGSSCDMPCVPTPTPTSPPPPPTPRPFDSASYTVESDRQNERAIALAKATVSAANIILRAGPGYTWTAATTDPEGVYTVDVIAQGEKLNSTFTPPDLHSASFETKLVCYCTRKGFGWRWEVHVDDGEVFYVNDNADLMKKYDITPSQ
jgi:hypothetical protein